MSCAGIMQDQLWNKYTKSTHWYHQRFVNLITWEWQSVLGLNNIAEILVLPILRVWWKLKWSIHLIRKFRMCFNDVGVKDPEESTIVLEFWLFSNRWAILLTFFESPTPTLLHLQPLFKLVIMENCYNGSTNKLL